MHNSQKFDDYHEASNTISDMWANSADCTGNIPQTAPSGDQCGARGKLGQEWRFQDWLA